MKSKQLLIHINHFSDIQINAQLADQLQQANKDFDIKEKFQHLNHPHLSQETV